MTDKVSKGRAATGLRSGSYTHPERQPRGERHGRAVLTWDQVRTIREASQQGTTGVTLAARYGVSPTTVSRIITNQNWQEV